MRYKKYEAPKRFIFLTNKTQIKAYRDEGLTTKALAAIGKFLADSPASSKL